MGIAYALEVDHSRFSTEFSVRRVVGTVNDRLGTLVRQKLKGNFI
jgi:hypothetical protein